jgi:type III secretion system low calcium response chaperone LcrH/SycD
METGQDKVQLLGKAILEHITRSIGGKTLEEVAAWVSEGQVTLLAELLKGKSPQEVADLEAGAEAMQELLRQGKPLYLSFGIDEFFVKELYAEGYRLYQAGKYRQAQPYFHAVCFLNAQEASYLLALAATYQRLQEYEEAIERYLWLADVQTEMPLPFFYLYECYMQLGQFDKAGGALEELVRRAAQSPVYAQQREKGQLLLEGHIAHYGGSTPARAAVPQQT